MFKVLHLNVAWKCCLCSIRQERERIPCFNENFYLNKSSYKIILYLWITLKISKNIFSVNLWLNHNFNTSHIPKVIHTFFYLNTLVESFSKYCPIFLIYSKYTEFFVQWFKAQVQNHKSIHFWQIYSYRWQKNLLQARLWTKSSS